MTFLSRQTPIRPVNLQKKRSWGLAGDGSWLRGTLVLFQTYRGLSQKKGKWGKKT